MSGRDSSGRVEGFPSGEECEEDEPLAPAGALPEEEAWRMAMGGYVSRDMAPPPPLRTFRSRKGVPQGLLAPTPPKASGRG